MEDMHVSWTNWSMVDVEGRLYSLGEFFRQI